MRETATGLGRTSAVNPLFKRILDAVIRCDGGGLGLHSVGVGASSPVSATSHSLQGSLPCYPSDVRSPTPPSPDSGDSRRFFPECSQAAQSVCCRRLQNPGSGADPGRRLEIECTKYKCRRTTQDVGTGRFGVMIPGSGS